MSITYTRGIPATNDNPSNDQPNMLINNDNIDTFLAVDHVGFNVSGIGQVSGQHNKVTFNSNNVPAVPTAPPVLFTNTVGGLPQLFFYSGDAAHSSQVYNLSSKGSTFLLGGIIFKWGSQAGVGNGNHVDFDHPFPNAVFNVQVTINIASTLQLVGVNGIDNTGFTFRTSGGGVPIFWTAIGY